MVPYPRRQSLYAQGRVAVNLGQPDVSIAYLRPLLSGGPLSREAALMSAIAQYRGGSLAASVDALKSLSRGRDLTALHAMLTLRDLTPSVRDRGFITTNLGKLHKTLSKQLTVFLTTHSKEPSAALKAVRAQESDGKASLPADLVGWLSLDPQLFSQRRRLRSIEVELTRLDAMEGTWLGTPAGTSIRAQLADERRASEVRCGLRVLSLVSEMNVKLNGLSDQLRPADIREQIFSPSYFTL